MPTYQPARCIGGDIRAVRCPTENDNIKVGDLLVLSAGGTARPAATAATQDALHDGFLGSSLEDKPASEVRDILVATAGVHRYALAAPLGAALNIGGYVGGVQGQSRIVASVATAGLAIGSLVKTHAIGATHLEFELAGVVSTPGRGAQAVP